MPEVTSGTVLVTGINGFLALWIAKKLFEKGYAVRGTIRSESKGGYIRELFKEYGDKLELVVVKDITKEGAFDEAVKGIDAIEHLASPFIMTDGEPSELITPAVAGTGSILQSALTHGKELKRFVLTSSVAAIMELLPDAPIFTEENWNEQSVRNCEELGKQAAQHDKYLASKALAERAAWAFIENHKNDIEFDFVVTNPAMIMGPPLQEVTDPFKLNASVLEWYISVVAGLRSNEELFAINNSWVDVNDAADAHVVVLQKPEAAGNRFLIVAGAYVWQEWVNVAHAQDNSLPAGNPDADLSKAVYQMRYSSEKAARILGITKYRTMEETTRDILAEFKKRGWIPAHQ
ncbi:NAD-P-binding protein [Trametopsis cervina]|nr:NAD-P-binding protein [Trametopsis cervina]